MSIVLSEKRLVVSIKESEPSFKDRLADLNSRLSLSKLGIESDGSIVEITQYKRRATSYGKLAQLGESIVDTYLRLFTVPVEIVTGDDIHEVFENYRPGSCMRYETCRELREIYAKNPDSVGVAVWRRGRHPALESGGSCLVWYGKNGYIDRMYANSYGLGVKNAIVRSIADSLRNEKGVGLVKTVYEKFDFLPYASKVAFTLKLTSDGYLPYCDTFSQCTYNPSEDTVKLSTYSGDFEAKDCDGTDARSGETASRHRCCACNYAIDEAEGRSLDGDGDIYCDDCFNERYDYCEYWDAYQPADEVQYVTLLNRRGQTRDMRVCDDALRADFHEYGGDAHDVEYIHEDVAIECDGIYLHEDDLADIDDPDADADKYLEPYFASDYHKISDCVWSATMGGWSMVADDSDFAQDVAKRCETFDNGLKGKSLGDAFRIVVQSQSAGFRLEHIKTGQDLGPIFTNLDGALRYAAKLLSFCTAELPQLFDPNLDVTGPMWTGNDGRTLRAFMNTL